MGSSAQEDLTSTAEHILKLRSSQEGEKPSALYSAFFNTNEHSIPEDSNPLPEGVVICPEFSPTEFGFDRHLAFAKAQFNAIVRILATGTEGEEIPQFFPPRPDPNEVAAAKEEEEEE